MELTVGSDEATSIRTGRPITPFGRSRPTSGARFAKTAGVLSKYSDRAQPEAMMHRVAVGR